MLGEGEGGGDDQSWIGDIREASGGKQERREAPLQTDELEEGGEEMRQDQFSVLFIYQ